MITGPADAPLPTLGGADPLRGPSAQTRPTLPETGSGDDKSAAFPAVALTILHHPHVARAGERAALGRADRPSSHPLSRVQLTFAAPGSSKEEPLSDEHVSRRPVYLDVSGTGAVTLKATDTPTKVVWRDRPIAEHTFSAAEIERGVVLLVAGRIVLLLHTALAGMPPVDGERFGLVGQSDGLRAVVSDIHAVADLKRPVLLRGPSGSGKELVARAIHAAGKRHAGPFVPVNLGAVPATIAAAELFGAEKGAFTGAVRRAGYFEQAQGGTLFLDEIGEAPGELQAALLRAIQDGEIQPLGADRPRKMDVRVVAATDANLEAKVQDGSFRAPLLNRLAAYQVWIPPLADRRDDIGRLLLRFFEEELAEVGEPGRLRTEQGASWLPAPLVAELCEHDYPGNVRQLRNVVHHLVIHGRRQPRVTMSPAAVRLLGGAGDTAAPSSEVPSSPPAAAPASAPASRPKSPRASTSARRPIDLSEAEIREALRASRWEIGAAAKRLGIARPSLYLAMKRFPSIRAATDLSVGEIREAHRAAGGDVARMADALEVSEKALFRRVRDLGL